MFASSTGALCQRTRCGTPLRSTVVKGTKQIIACRECGTFWDDAGQPTCLEAEHPKTQHTLHVHEDEVALPDGTTIMAVSYDEEYERNRVPDFGLYLDSRWSPPWPHDHVDWADFGLPGDRVRFREQLLELLARARKGQRVEVGCLGGHGRTGTALAVAAVLSGHDASAATAWVRKTYCAHAVETPEQEGFVRKFSNVG